MNKKDLIESDIRTKFITPNVVPAGQDETTPIRLCAASRSCVEEQVRVFDMSE